MDVKLVIALFFILSLVLVALIVLKPLSYVANLIYGNKWNEITFYRTLECDRCGQHKAPPLTDVKITVSASVSSPIEGAILTDYFPAEWYVVNANGGTVSNFNSNFKKIEWNVGIVYSDALRWYIVKSPQRTTPSTKYYFYSKLENKQSDLWQILVSDPEPDYSQCDVNITSLPYYIDQNDTYYCLNQSFYDVYSGYGTNAINFNYSIQGSTLDCLGYTIDGNSSTSSIGVNLYRNPNNTIKNCNISEFSIGVFGSYCNYTNVINNSFFNIYKQYSNYQAINFYLCYYSNLSYNTFQNVYKAIVLQSPDVTISNNIIRNFSNDAIHLYSGNVKIENNYFEGGSEAIHLDGASDVIINNNTIIGLKDSNYYSILIYYYPSIYGSYNIITNNNITNTTVSIKIYANDNTIIENNSLNGLVLDSMVSGGRGHYHEPSENTTIKNNTITDGYGIEINSGINNTLIDNTIYNNTYGIYFSYEPDIGPAANNTIIGGFINGNDYDYLFSNTDGLNYIINTNFNDFAVITFSDTISWFNYNNNTYPNIWLKTGVSSATNVSRKIINWSPSLLQWIDKNITGIDITARYNITGLSANRNYTIYNNSILAYNLKTDSDGQLNFTIDLSGENEILVSLLIYCGDSYCDSGETCLNCDDCTCPGSPECCGSSCCSIGQICCPGDVCKSPPCVIYPSCQYSTQATCLAEGCHWCNNACQQSQCSATYSMSFVNVPSLIEINQSSSKSICFDLKNDGTGNISSIYISLSTIPSSWFTINPSYIEKLDSNSNSSICVGFSIPQEAIAEDYLITVTARNNISTTAATILRIQENQTPIKPTCPASCPSPTNWTDCLNNNRARISYYCNSTSNYICQFYTESEACETIIEPPAIDFLRLLPFIVFGTIVVIVLIVVYKFSGGSSPYKYYEQQTKVKEIQEMKHKLVQKKAPAAVKTKTAKKVSAGKPIRPIEMICPQCNSKMELKYSGEALSSYQCKKCGYSEIKKIGTEG